MLTKPTSAYVHIPFCTQICYYCDFSKVFIKNQPVDAYLQALIREFESYDIKKLRTLYIGGGTPTSITAEQLEYLLTNLTKHLDLSVLEEFTIEANPGDLTEDKIEVLKNSAVNRVSLGVQTFNDKHLKQIGRSHNEAQIYSTISNLKKAGFHNISIDLIYALPGQTMEDVKENVAKAIALDIPHLSLYSLILEHHTVFMNKMRRGKLQLPKEDLEAKMFEYIISELEANGFEHYEISNFTKPGFESRHNLMYWDNAEYFGVGAGASGYLNGVRYRNRGPIQHYLKAVAEGNARLAEEALTKDEMMEEELFLGLRKKSGVSIARFEEKFGLSFEDRYGQIVRELCEQGLLVTDDKVIRMTKKGLFLGDTDRREIYIGVKKMGLSYQEKYQVPFYESDINQNMKLSQLLSLVLQVSGKQSLSLGMSDEYVFQTYNLVWIITEYAIEIDRLPRYTENIVIETVPTAYNKLFCYRDFNVYGQDGEKILTIHSTFVLMDYDTRKVHPVVDDIVDVYQVEKVKKIYRGPRYEGLENPEETHLSRAFLRP